VARETHDSPGKLAPPPLDALVAELAARQHGVVTADQLRSCGLNRGGIEHRLAVRRLQRLYRGVYAFGHRELTTAGRLLAAVLACGPGAVLSHFSAAVLWALLRPEYGPVDVTVPRRTGRAKRPGIRIHSVRDLDPRDVTVKDGIPVTTPAKTLIDLNAVVGDRLVERAFEQAQILRLIRPGEVEDVLDRSNGRRTRALRRLVDADRRTSTVTRSELEERFLGLVRRGGLPEPEVNVRLAGYEVDFLWRPERRVIEVDGHAYHSTRQATSRDRRKDDDLEAAGFRVTRFTTDQVLFDPMDTLARAKRALEGARPEAA
jgi:very-short-patch-repair endonuclease